MERKYLVHLLNLAGLPGPGLCLGGSRFTIGFARLALHQAEDCVTIISICLIQLLFNSIIDASLLALKKIWLLTASSSETNISSLIG